MNILQSLSRPIASRKSANCPLPKQARRNVVIGLVLFVAIKWTIAGAIAAIAMMSMQAVPAIGFADSQVELTPSAMDQ